MIQRNDPDVIILNEFDYDDISLRLWNFRKEYLGAGQRGQSPVDFPIVTALLLIRESIPAWISMETVPWGTLAMLTALVNTLVITVWPSCRSIRWMPTTPALSRSCCGLICRATRFRWSTTSQPLRAAPSACAYRANLIGMSLADGGGAVPSSSLTSHSALVEGPERLATKRNGDEIRLMADYIAGGERAKWIVGTTNLRRGDKSDEHFIFFGDQNSDPSDGGNSGQASIGQILGLERVCDPKPTSRGAVKAAEEQTGNAGTRTHTSRTPQTSVSRRRATCASITSYLLQPGRGGQPKYSGPPQEELGELMGPDATSDHHLVWARLR